MLFISYIIYFSSSILTLWLPNLGESSLVEFGSAIPEGLHRCTTKTSNWYLKQEFPENENPILDQFYPCDINQVEMVEDSQNTSTKENSEKGGMEETMEETMDGSSNVKPDLKKKVKKKICEETDSRRYHLYRLLKINAIFIVVDSPKRPMRFDGRVEEWSDGPVEGKIF